MNRFLRFLWRNRASVVLLAALTLAAGLAAGARLPQTIFPDLAFPKVVVLVADGDVPVRLMLLQVTRPLELAAQGEPGVRLVNSQTGNGLSKVHVYFAAGTDPALAFLLLQARLATIRLPPGARLTVRLQTPEVYPLSEYALVSNRVTSSAMRPFFAFALRPALLGVSGVYRVNGTGRGWPEVQLELSARRLAAHGLTAAQVVTALRAAQGPYFSGVRTRFHQQSVVVTAPRPATPAALARMILPIGPPGAARPLTLGALGRVRIAPPPMLVGAAVAGWKHALVVDVLPEAGVNQAALGRAIARRLAALARHLPAGVHLVPIYDLGRLIGSSLHDVWLALILGSVIAWAVVLAFLRRLGAALATLLVVPLSIAGTLLALRVLGLGLNVMTLGGLTAAIGALVDHAIVVMERGLAARGATPAARRDDALARAGRILPAMTLATATSCLVFLPLSALSGTIGLLFRQMALTIVVALLASQLVALTLTPVLAVWLAGRGGAEAAWQHRWRRRFVRLLLRGMRRPWVLAPFALGLAGLGVLALFRLPTGFLPPWDQGVLSIPFRTPVGSSPAETRRVGRRLMQVALADPAVARASLVVGRSFANPRSVPNKGALAVVLKQRRDVGTPVVMQRLWRAFHTADPALIAVGGSQGMVNRLGDLSGAHAPLEIFLFGSDSAALRKAGARLAARLRRSGRFQAIQFKSPSAGPEIALRPRAAAALRGVTAPALAGAVRRLLWGQRAGFLLAGEQIMPIRVRVRPDPGGIGTLALRLPVSSGADPPAAFAPLASLARIHRLAGVPFVTHQALVPDAYIWLRPVPGEGLAQAAAAARRVIAAAGLGPGISARLRGYYAQQRRGFRQMFAVLGGTLLVLLVLLGFQFDGQRAALAALGAIALAAPGALAALWAMRLALDSTAFLGVLIVYAIAVNNVILIFAGHGGRPSSVALAAGTRLRPIVMTMLADIGGFLPLVIGVGRGTALLRPLAVAVMGGLGLATVTSLWAAPVLAALLWRRRQGSCGGDATGMGGN